jgi:hypothetical protein
MTDPAPLESLYPFLHGGKQDARRLELALLESVRQKAADSADTNRRFFEASGAEVVAAARTIGLAGYDGGRMAGAGLDHCLVVPSDSIHRIQETHVAIYHILWDLVHTLLADERGGLATGRGA